MFELMNLVKTVFTCYGLMKFFNPVINLWISHVVKTSLFLLKSLEMYNKCYYYCIISKYIQSFDF